MAVRKDFFSYAALLTVIFLLLLLITFSNLDVLFSDRKFFLDNALTVLGIFAAVVSALLVHSFASGENHNRRIREQVKLIEGLLGELDILDGFSTKLYGGETTKGNLNWYSEEIAKGKDYLNRIDHEINPINIDLYIANLDSSLSNELKIGQLVRTLSNLNDKISQLNYHIFRNKDTKTDKAYLLSIIGESITKIRVLRQALIFQRKDLLANLV